MTVTWQHKTYTLKTEADVQKFCETKLKASRAE